MKLLFRIALGLARLLRVVVMIIWSECLGRRKSHVLGSLWVRSSSAGVTMYLLLLAASFPVCFQRRNAPLSLCVQVSSGCFDLSKPSSI